MPYAIVETPTGGYRVVNTQTGEQHSFHDMPLGKAQAQWRILEGAHKKKEGIKPSRERQHSPKPVRVSKAEEIREERLTRRAHAERHARAVSRSRSRSRSPSPRRSARSPSPHRRARSPSPRRSAVRRSPSPQRRARSRSPHRRGRRY